MNTAFHSNACSRFARERILSRSSSGFTLFELLLAVVIFAIVLAAINTVFYSALRLRTKVAEALDSAHSVNQALSSIRRDLQNAIPPGIVLAGALKIGALTNTVASAQAMGIEIYTTTGILSENVPWGDIQKVTYQLREPLERNQPGRDLIRCVTRNLLATTLEQVEEQWLLGGIDTLQFAAYTGNEWRDTWDTSMGDSGLPTAVRVRLQQAVTDPNVDLRNRQPIELIVPLMAQGTTNLTQTTGGQL